MIYTIGNSHSHFFTNSNPGTIGWGENNTEIFKSYSANFHNKQYPHVLAHKFNERFFPHFIPVINEIQFCSKDYLMLIVGEIDCRWHFPKKIKTQNRDIENVLNEELNYFFPSFLELKENGYNVIGWGVHPSTIRGHHDPDPDDPIYGNSSFRNEISRKGNSLLETQCNLHDMPFISIMEVLLNEKKETKMEFFLDDFHLNQKAIPFVLEKLKTKKLL